MKRTLPLFLFLCLPLCTLAQEPAPKEAVTFPSEPTPPQPKPPSNMSPVFSVDDQANQRPANAVLNSENFVRHSAETITPSYFDHGIVCQFSLNMGFSTRGSTLSGLVLSIISSRSKEEMNWIDARRIVAPMADVETVRNRTDHKFVGDTVRLEHSEPAILFSEQLTITRALNVDASSPQDATVSSFLPNGVEEPFVKRSYEVATFLRTVFSSPACNFASLGKKVIATSLASDCLSRTVSRHADTSYKVQCVGAAHQRRSVIL